MPFDPSIPLVDPPLQPAIAALPQSDLTIFSEVQRVGRSLLFVDGSVADYQQLVAGVQAGTEVQVLDPWRDAIDQITQTLQNQTGISSLHLISHGESGGLDFGSSQLNLADLPDYVDRLQTWRQALTVDADVLLYGCNVAAGEQGRTFVHQLAQTIGAEVTASTNLTGDAGQGGDWTLEFQTGTIEAAPAFDPRVLRSYHGTLAPFTAGNLVVVRVGDGSGTLGTAATASFLDEYTPTGTLVQSIALPIAASGSNAQFTLSGNATSEGGLSRSTDGQYLTLAGYDAAVGTPNVANTSSASVNRIVARVGVDGTIDTSTRISDGYSTNNIRSAATIDGTGFWTGGTGTGGGTRYVTFGGSGSSTQISTTTANTRVVNLFDGQLYTSSASGTLRLATVGTGTPTTSGQTTTNMPGFPTTGSPYGFFFADLDGTPGVDTVYVADDGASQIQKFSLVSGSWVLNGSVAATQIRGLTGSVSGTTVNLFGSTGSTFPSGGGSVYSFADTSGYNGTIAGSATSIASAPTLSVFRGIAFAPVAQVSLTTATPSIAEGSSGSFTISRGSSTVGDLVVNLTIDSSSTVTSGDYSLSGASVAVSGSDLKITIPNGSSSVSLNMAALAEAIGFAEATETLKLNLATGFGYSLSASTTATIAIAANGTIVTTTGDSTSSYLEGSLRQAILNSNAFAGTQDIAFSLPAGPQTIVVNPLPNLTDSVNLRNTTGAANLTIQGTATTFALFQVQPGATVSFEQLTLSNSLDGIANQGGTIALIQDVIITGATGAAIRNNTATSRISSINRVTLIDNSSNTIVNSGILTSLTNSTIRTTAAAIAGISNFATGTIDTITNSTISGPFDLGLRNFGQLGTMENSTISGAGLGLQNTGTITTLRNTTIASSLNNGLDNAGTIANFYNTLLVGNGSNSLGSGSITNQSNNLIGTFAALGVDPSLSNYGGSTLTYALLPSSAAINAGTSISAPSSDQRGVARSDGAIDIGAFESRGFAIVPTSGNNQSAFRNTAFNPLVVSVTSAFGEPVNGGVVTFTAPTTGASITVPSQTATIASGQASITPIANNTLGSYSVLASASASTSFALTNANRIPTVASFSKTGNQGGTIAFQSSDFSSQFSDGDPGETLSSIRITALPTHGTLRLNGVAIVPNADIPLAQLSGLAYTPSPAYSGSDSFSWSGSDGFDYAPTAASVSLTIAPDLTLPPPTMPPPIVPPVPVQQKAIVSDFDGDGKADLLLTRTNGKPNQPTSLDYSLLLSRTGLRLPFTTLTPNFQLVATADFNGDGKTDLLWRNTENNTYSNWLMDGASYIGGGIITVLPFNFEVVATADFNGDGKTDLLWRNTENNTYSNWLMDNFTYIGGGIIATLPSNFEIASSADFNGDGRADLLWRDKTSNTYSTWLLDGFSYSGGGTIATVSSNFEIIATRDYNGDGRSDLLWHNTDNNAYSLWFLDGATYLNGGTIARLPATFEVVVSRDYNGDGRSDLLWQNRSNGALSEWFLDGYTYIGGAEVGSLNADEAVRG